MLLSVAPVALRGGTQFISIHRISQQRPFETFGTCLVRPGCGALRIGGIA